MGWVDDPALEPGEAVVASWNANHTVDWRAVGGKLSLTTTHLRFEPNAVDRATAGKAWAVPLTDVREVGIADRSLRGGGPFLAGLRRRLSVSLVDGTTELFLVNRVQERAEQIRAAL